jgi:hypothetical protein
MKDAIALILGLVICAFRGVNAPRKLDRLK